jgi:hypothetical protein
MFDFIIQLAEDISKAQNASADDTITLLRAFGEEIDRLDPRNFPSDSRTQFIKMREKARYWAGQPGFMDTDYHELAALGNQALDFFTSVRRTHSDAQGSIKSDLHTNKMTLDIFISHSSSDNDIAKGLIELLLAAINVPHERIRCTSVDGYRLPAGVATDEILKQEVRHSNCFIGLLTPQSLRSPYVLFELGARWGAQLNFKPLLAGGATSKDLSAPISSLNALSCYSAAQLHQLVYEIANNLGTHCNPPAVYEGKIQHLMELAVQKIEATEDEVEHIQKNTPVNLQIHPGYHLKPTTEAGKELLELIKKEADPNLRGLVVINKGIEPNVTHFFGKLVYSGTPLGAKTRLFREGLDELVKLQWLHPPEFDDSTDTNTYEFKGD